MSQQQRTVAVADFEAGARLLPAPGSSRPAAGPSASLRFEAGGSPAVRPAVDETVDTGRVPASLPTPNPAQEGNSASQREAAHLQRGASYLEGRIAGTGESSGLNQADAMRGDKTAPKVFRAPNSSDLMRRTEAAACLGVSVRTLERWLNDGLIGYVFMGRRILFKRADIEAFIAERTVSARDGAGRTRTGRSRPVVRPGREAA